MTDFTLDIRTVFIVTVLICTALSTSFSVFFLLHRNTRGIATWFAAMLVMTAGFLLIALRGLIPDPVSIVAGNSLVVGGLALFSTGVRAFFGKTGGWAWEAGPVAALFLSFLYFTFVDFDLVWRILIFSAVAAVLLGHLSILLMRYRQSRSTQVHPVVFFATWTLCAVFALRAVLTAVGIGAPETQSFMSPNTVTAVTLLIEIVVFILLSIGLVSLPGQRAVYEVAESESRYKNLAEVAPNAILVHDFSRVTYANETAVDLFADGDPAGLIGKPVLDMYHPDSLDLAKRRMLRLVKRPGDIGFAEERLIRHDGSSFQAEVGDRSINWQGKPGIQVVIRDITERKRIEEALRNSNLDLEQFGYAISHDLQEPLRMVTSYLGLLDKRLGPKLEASEKEYMAFAVDGAKRMQVMIRDLLEYSRIDTKGAKPIPTDSNEAFQAAMANLKVAIAEAGAEVSAGDLPWVLADESQLARLFQNIIGNAVKYRADDRPPEISVAAERLGDVWRFSVNDNGIGIAPEHFERVFAVFQRLHGRGEYDGTGIGLAVCKRIVERHGGRIWVESRPSEGSTFYFTLPAAD